MQPLGGLLVPALSLGLAGKPPRYRDFTRHAELIASKEWLNAYKRQTTAISSNQKRNNTAHITGNTSRG